VAARTGEHERGARLLGAAAAMLPATGEPLRSGPRHFQDSIVRTIRAMLGEAATDAALAAGAALSLDDAIAEALAIGGASVVPHVAGETDPSISSPAGALTARELDVLRLVAAGRTDREIAETLFVSRRTVNTHVANILAKLGVATRRDAVERAREQGSLPTADAPPRYT
jgi:non-specific serine/threonine protein kinase